MKRNKLVKCESFLEIQNILQESISLLEALSEQNWKTE